MTPQAGTNLLAGSAAGVTAVVSTYPLDVVRARMALQTEGTMRVFRQTLTTEECH
jgi:hypothetical protein